MDVTGDANTAFGNITSQVFLTFLQQKGCQNVELEQELSDLERKLKHVQDINCNSVGLACTYGAPNREVYSGDDDELQTDGHSPSVNFQHLLQNHHPNVHAPPPAVPIPDPALRGVALELIEIADQLENSVMARATDNLLRSLQNSNSLQWSKHLAQAVENVHGALQRSRGLDDLPQERLLMALSLSLIKGVCERTPRFLCDLFRIWQQQDHHLRD